MESQSADELNAIKNKIHELLKSGEIEKLKNLLSENIQSQEGKDIVKEIFNMLP